jgi:hypothetical protein
VPGLGISFLARRARASWLLLACVAVMVLLATGLATVLWTFAVAAAPVPSALPVLPIGLAALALVTAVGPAAAAALSVARRPDPAAQLRAEAR